MHLDQQPISWIVNFWQKCCAFQLKILDVSSVSRCTLEYVQKVSKQSLHLHGEWLSRILKEGSRSVWPWAAMLLITYGGELLNLWIWWDLRTVPLNLLCDNLYAYVILVHTRKATYAKLDYLTSIATKKSRGTITRLHTWRQDGRHSRLSL